MKRPTLALAALAALAACSDDNPVWRNGEPPALIGDWRGTVAEGVMTQADAVCSMQTSGAIGCAFFDAVSGAPAGALNGTVEQSTTLEGGGPPLAGDGPAKVSGEFADAAAQVYAADAATGALVPAAPAPVDLTGRITDEGAQLELAWGALELIAIRQSALESSLGAIAGTYTVELPGADTAALTIDAAGVLTGQGASGCALTGNVAPGAPGSPGYSVSVTLAGCTIDGPATGFALKRGAEIVLAVFGAGGALVTRGAP